MREIVFVDGETRSMSDLRVVGGAAYAECPTTESMVWVFIKGTEGIIWIPHELRKMKHEASAYLPTTPWTASVEFELFTGPDIPGKLISWKDCEWAAHNGHGFDRLVWNKLYPTCRVETWVDTLKVSKRAGLPGSLDGVGEALFGLGKHSGKSTLMALCKPSEKHGGFLPLNRKNIIPLTAYCVQDVLLMREAWHKTLRYYAEAADDAALKACDIVNNYGALLDVELAQTIIDLELGLREKRGEQLESLTGGAVTRALLRSPKQLREYFYKTWDIVLENTQRGTLNDLLESEELAENTLAKLIIEARLGETRITSTKLVRALDCLTIDGRMKFILAYHAAHTGRWGGRKFQPQNLPRGKLNAEDLAYCLEILLCKDLSLEDKILTVDLVIPENITIGDALGSLVRSCVVAPKGKRLGIADFAAIECRGLLWLAGDEAGLDNFRRDLDPYKVFATKVFGVAYEDVTKEMRTVCKPPILGCIAEGTPVLTNRGWVKIEKVTPSMKVWDGVEWVSFDECVPQGRKLVTQLNGVYLTPDHKVLSKDGTWLRADIFKENSSAHPQKLGISLAISKSKLSPAALAEQLGKCHCGACFVRPQGMWSGTTGTFFKDARPVVTSALRRQPTTREVSILMSALIKRYVRGFSIESTRFDLDARNQPTEPTRIMENVVLEFVSAAIESFCDTCLLSLDTKIQALRSTELTMMETTLPGIFDSWIVELTSETPPTRYVETYDLVNSGPRSRFSVPYMIVHNCGYQISGEKLEAYALGMGIDLKKFGWTGPMLVDMWRKANPLIAGEETGDEYEGRPVRKGGLWKDFQYGAIKVVETGIEKHVGKCRLFMRGSDFIIRLPSGKEIVYRNALVEDVENQWGGMTRSFTFDRPFGSKVIRASQYGGKWVENVVQALCTGSGGLTGEALARLVEAEFKVVLHVHDEIVTELESRGQFLRFLYLMNKLPDWAVGFPNKTCGFDAARYMKEAPVDINVDLFGDLILTHVGEVAILDDGYGNIEWRGVTEKELKWLKKHGMA